MEKLKDYRIEVKVKNNVLYKLMRSRGIETIAELSRLSKVGLPRLYQYMNLTGIPYAEHKRYVDGKLLHVEEGVFKPSAIKLAQFLNVTPYELFPLQHLDKPLLVNKAESELSFDEITQYILPGEDKPLIEEGLFEPEQKVFDNEKEDAINKMLKTLNHNEEMAIRLYYGLDGKEHTLKEVGEHLDRETTGRKDNSKPLSRERVRQIIMKAERKMRHKSRSEDLKKFY